MAAYPDNFDWSYMRSPAALIRVYPLIDTVGTAHPRLDEIRVVLAEHRVETELRTAAYAFVRGSDHLLACRRV
jgi:hypothetical protein